MPPVPLALPPLAGSPSDILRLSSDSRVTPAAAHRHLSSLSPRTSPGATNMPANPSQTDPARRALNIDTACNLAIIYHSPLACQAPDSCHAPSQPSSHGTRVTDAHDRSDSPPPPPTRPRGPMPLAYRPKSSDFLPTSQHGGDGLRPTNASGAPSTSGPPSTNASGTRSTSSDIRSTNIGAPSTTSRVRWKIPTPLGAVSVTDAERIEILREGLREVHHRVRVHEVSYGGGRNRREIFPRVDEGEGEAESVDGIDKEGV